MDKMDQSIHIVHKILPSKDSKQVLEQTHSHRPNIEQHTKIPPLSKPHIRQKHIDLLMVILTWCVLLGHSLGKTTKYFPIPAKNNSGVLFESIREFICGIHMEFFFFLSGINSYLSLNRYKLISKWSGKWIEIHLKKDIRLMNT